MKVKMVQTFVDDALVHVEKLLDASRGDEARCTALRELDESQRGAVRRYLESWVEPQLRAALVLLDEPARTPYSLTSYVDIIRRTSQRSRFAGELEAASQDGPDELREFVSEKVSG